MYQWSEDSNEHANRFYQVMIASIEEITKKGLDENRLSFQKHYYDNVYSWEVRKDQWRALLESFA
jgi:hypothetical protein